MKDLKKHIIRVVFFSTLFLSLATVMSAQQYPACSAASAAGRWGHTFTGTLILPTGAVPVAAVGRVSIDVGGNVSGTETTVIGGKVSEDETIKGTVSVDSDCGAKLAVSIYDQSGNLVRSGTWNVVFDDNAREFRAIVTSLVLPNGTTVPAVTTLTARKIFAWTFR
jgi:hypothetical protein